ncbi:hypothetical protein TNCV_3476351 [Trichonephila clavipes]|nr:hypothetical protein TNCV_3476351 [Trichonephila clavipes]
MALAGSLPQINLGVQGVTQGGHHKVNFIRESALLCSGDLSSFRALGAEDLQVPLALVDQDLKKKICVRAQITGPFQALGARPKIPMDKPALLLWH